MKKSVTVFLMIWNCVVQAQDPIPKTAQQIYEQGLVYLSKSGDHFISQSFDSFTLSAGLGYAKAMNALGNMYLVQSPSKLDSAIYWYGKAGENGYANAYFNLAELFRKGESGIEQNFVEAFNFYKKAAALNHLESKNIVAYMFFKGLGVQQSYDSAFILYQELADIGHVNAQYFLGLCYRNGYGTKPHDKLAKKWLELAAANNDRQAIHELTFEPLPENMSIVTDKLQKQVNDLKNHNEKYLASNTNDISGIYSGYAIYYDFSGKFINQILPLTLTLKRGSYSYEGTWVEGDSLEAAIKASFEDNTIKFYPSSKYTRHNYYSYRAPEEYVFKSGLLNTKYLNDSLYISGNIQFYSLSRKEPGQPIYIAIGKKIERNIIQQGRNLKLALSPNPTNNIIKADFTIKGSTKVQLRIMSLNGTIILQSSQETLSAGSYSYNFEVLNLTAGNYVLQVTTDTGSEQKLFIKF